MEGRAHYANGPTNTLTTHRLDCPAVKRCNHQDATDSGGWTFQYANQRLVIVAPAKPGARERLCKRCKP